MIKNKKTKGLQQWSDGSSFEGAFYEDKRNGRGKHSWISGDVITFYTYISNF